jgi:hypothetical protein
MMKTTTTDCGIPHIGKIQWGSHICHFFQKRDDLVRALVPYFRAGLENGERCIWVTGDPFRAAEAQSELARSMVNLDRFLREGRIRILDAEDWYARSTESRKESVIDSWLREEKEAALASCVGLRIAGNLSYLKQEDMASFMEYETQVNRVFPSHQIVALCSYDIRKCGSSDVSNIVRAHRYTLGRVDNGWEITVTARPT